MNIESKIQFSTLKNIHIGIDVFKPDDDSIDSIVKTYYNDNIPENTSANVLLAFIYALKSFSSDCGISESQLLTILNDVLDDIKCNPDDYQPLNEIDESAYDTFNDTDESAYDEIVF